MALAAGVCGMGAVAEAVSPPTHPRVHARLRSPETLEAVTLACVRPCCPGCACAVPSWLRPLIALRVYVCFAAVEDAWEHISHGGRECGSF
eukprot:364839-Chlamydomonas_euryale.AAC.9